MQNARACTNTCHTTRAGQGEGERCEGGQGEVERGGGESDEVSEVGVSGDIHTYILIRSQLPIGDGILGCCNILPYCQSMHDRNL